MAKAARVQPHGDDLPFEEDHPLIVRKSDALRPGQRFDFEPQPPDDRGIRWNLVDTRNNGMLIVTRTTPVHDDPELLNLWYRAVDFLNVG